MVTEPLPSADEWVMLSQKGKTETTENIYWLRLTLSKRRNHHPSSAIEYFNVDFTRLASTHAKDNVYTRKELNSYTICLVDANMAWRHVKPFEATEKTVTNFSYLCLELNAGVPHLVWESLRLKGTVNRSTKLRELKIKYKSNSVEIFFHARFDLMTFVDCERRTVSFRIQPEDNTIWNWIDRQFFDFVITHKPPDSSAKS